jgi:hypothetical protein
MLCFGYSEKYTYKHWKQLSWIGKVLDVVCRTIFTVSITLCVVRGVGVGVFLHTHLYALRTSSKEQNRVKINYSRTLRNLVLGHQDFTIKSESSMAIHRSWKRNIFSVFKKNLSFEVKNYFLRLSYEMFIRNVINYLLMWMKLWESQV